MLDNQLISATNKIRKVLKSNPLTISDSAVVLLDEIGNLMEGSSNETGFVYLEVTEICHNPNMVQYDLFVSGKRNTIHMEKYDERTMLSLLLLIHKQFSEQNDVKLAPNKTLLYGRLFELPSGR